MDNCDLILSKCREGNYAAFECFISEGVSPNIQNLEGKSMLHIAAANGYIDIANVLLKKGALVDLPNNYGWTALMLAARHGHTDMVSLLIQSKAKVNASNRLGLRPIDFAAWSGNVSCLNLLIESGAVIDNMPPSNTEDVLCDLSSLMAAAVQGHDMVLRILLEKGSSVNQASPITELTPLIVAAFCGYLHVIEILIEWGIDVNAADICGRTALELALACNKKDVVSYLEMLTRPASTITASGVINIDILQAVKNGDITSVRTILQQNQSLCNYLELPDSITPLMTASMYGHMNIVETLVSSGADLNAQDSKDGWTALMYSVFHRQAETVHLLLDKGAKVDILTFNGYTALDLATHIDSSETDIVETLTAYSSPPEMLETQEYLTASPSITMKRSHLSAEKVSAKEGSQARLKDWIGGLSSHIRQFSKSSAATSPAADTLVFDESFSEVFHDEDGSKKPLEGKYLSISKFYAPDQRFAHQLKEQKVEALVLPPLPHGSSYIHSVKQYSKKNRMSNESKNSFNSLRVPNLMKSYMKRKIAGNYMNSDETFSSKGLETQDLTLLNIKYASTALRQSSNTSDLFHTAKVASKGSISVANAKNLNSNMKVADKKTTEKYNIYAFNDLSDILNQGSLQKYAEKFKNQEIDLEAFQHLTEDDLTEIGVQSLESRNKFMEIITQFKKHN